jgi:hypothetical protein
LSAGYIALLVYRPGAACFIAKFLKNIRRFAQGPASACIIAANLYDIGQIVKTACNSQAVRQHTPAREASLKIALRRIVVASIPRRYT